MHVPKCKAAALWCGLTLPLLAVIAGAALPVAAQMHQP